MASGPAPSHSSRDAIWFVRRRRLDAERVGEPDEKTEQGGHIDSLSDLLIGPAHLAQTLDLLVCHPVGRPAYRAGKFQQQAFRRGEAGGVEVTVAERIRHPLELLALQLQEPRMRAQSIPAAVES